jgi:hypothetical protein
VVLCVRPLCYTEATGHKLAAQGGLDRRVYLEQVRHTRVDLAYALVLLLIVVQYLQERFVDHRIGDEPILDKGTSIIVSVTIQF